MNEKRWSKSTLLALVIFVVFMTGGCGREQAPEPREVVRPVKMLRLGADAGRDVTYTARVEAVNQVDIAFRVGGPLIEFPVLEGQFIRRGQLLARIDPRDFQIRLNAARADYERARADYRRFSSLYEKEAISEAQLDQARALRDVSQAAVEDAEAALGDTRLEAPFGGRIGETFVENFENVQAKEPILSLIDVSSVDVIVDAPESVLARLSGPERAQFSARFDTAPSRRFDLRPKEIATQADPRTQTYRVTFTMRQPEGINVLPGMTAQVVRHGSVSDDIRLVVPAVAVFADSAGNPQVWIVDEGAMTVARRPVRTGELSGSDAIELVDGVEPGETIAVSGATQLRDGMKVRELVQ